MADQVVIAQVGFPHEGSPDTGSNFLLASETQPPLPGTLFQVVLSCLSSAEVSGERLPCLLFFFFFLNHQVRREKAACSIALSDGYSGGLWPPKTWLQMGLLSSCCSHETKAFSVWATPTPLHSGNFFVLRNRAVIVTLPCSFGPSRSQDPVTLFLNIIEHPLQRAFANIWVISMDAYHIRNENILAL